MRSMLTWGGVLAGSVVLGMGMYGLVVAPATEGLEVLGITATPQERPTVLKTSTRKPERKPSPKPAEPVATAVEYRAPAPAPPAQEVAESDDYEAATSSGRGGDSDDWDDDDSDHDDSGDDDRDDDEGDDD